MVRHNAFLKYIAIVNGGFSRENVRISRFHTFGPLSIIYTNVTTTTFY